MEQVGPTMPVLGVTACQSGSVQRDWVGSYVVEKRPLVLAACDPAVGPHAPANMPSSHVLRARVGFARNCAVASQTCWACVGGTGWKHCSLYTPTQETLIAELRVSRSFPSGTSSVRVLE